MNADKLDYSGLDSDEEWTEPDLHGDTEDDFGVPDDQQWDEMSMGARAEVADNFLLGTAQADDFGDLNLPVVDPEGDLDPSNDQLNKKGLDAADSYVYQTEGYSDEELQEADDKIQRLQKKFDRKR